MSEDRNSPSGGNHLPRRVILRGKDSFDTLFKNGIRIAAGHIDLRYLTRQEPDPSIHIGFVVGKKTGNAVVRNRCKRLLREAYRLQQHILDPIRSQRSTSIDMVLIVKSADLTYAKAMADVQKLLNSLLRRISKPEELT